MGTESVTTPILELSSKLAVDFESFRGFKRPENKGAKSRNRVSPRRDEHSVADYPFTFST